MGIWKTSRVEEQPEIKLTDWKLIQVIKDGLKTLHFVGYNAANLEGRVSSAITEISMLGEDVVGTTASGRKYIASGSMGFNEEAEYVLSNWIIINGFAPENISDFNGNL